MGVGMGPAQARRWRAALVALVSGCAVAAAGAVVPTARANHEWEHEYVYRSSLGDAEPRRAPASQGIPIDSRIGIGYAYDLQMEWEPRHRRVWVEREGGLVVFDARGRQLRSLSGLTATDIVVDPRRGRVLVLDAERNELVVVDAKTLEVARRWPFFPGGGDGSAEPGSALCVGGSVGYQAGAVWFSHASSAEPDRCGAAEDYTGALDPDDGRVAHFVPVEGLRGSDPPHVMSSPGYQAVPRSNDLLVQTSFNLNPHLYRMRAQAFPSPRLVVQADARQADRADELAVDADGSHVVMPAHTPDHYRRRVSDLSPAPFDGHLVKTAASFAPDGRLATGSRYNFGGDPRVFSRNEIHPFRRFDYGNPHYSPNPQLLDGALAMGDRKLYAITDGEDRDDRLLFVHHVGLPTRVQAGPDQRRVSAGSRVRIRVQVRPAARRRIVIYRVRDDKSTVVVRRGRTDRRGRLTRRVRPTSSPRTFLMRVREKGARGPASDRIRVRVRR